MSSLVTVPTRVRVSSRRAAVCHAAEAERLSRKARARVPRAASRCRIRGSPVRKDVSNFSCRGSLVCLEKRLPCAHPAQARESRVDTPATTSLSGHVEIVRLRLVDPRPPNILTRCRARAGENTTPHARAARRSGCSSQGLRRRTRSRKRSRSSWSYRTSISRNTTQARACAASA